MQRINRKQFPAVDTVTLFFMASNLILLFVAHPFIQWITKKFDLQEHELFLLAAMLQFCLFIVNAGCFIHILRSHNRKLLAEENRLRASEDHNRLYARVFESSLEGILITDAASRIIAVNQAFTRTTGYTEDEVLGSTPGILRSERHDADFYQSMWASIRRTGSWHGEMWNRRKDGTIFPEWLIINAMTDTKGDITGYVGIFSDISERKKAEEKLRLHARVFDSSHEGIMITDTKGVILSVNPAFTLTTGFSREEAIGQTPRILNSGQQPKDFYLGMWASIHHTGSWQGEIWNKRKNGELYAEWLTIKAVKDENQQVCQYVAIFTDITERKQAEENLKYLAHYDVLTGLPNRLFFHEKFQETLQKAEACGTIVGLLFIDLDRFKVINDTLGHETGDRLLIQAAHRLQDCVKSHHTVARLGGDEFTVILPELKGPEEASSVAGMILEELSRAFYIDDHEFYVTGSVGISMYPKDGQDLDTLLKNADSAMYVAKENKNEYQLFLPKWSEELPRRMELEQNLRTAVQKGQLELYYQPQADCLTGELTGVEALVRWNHPELGLISPQEFIPLAEEIGIITEIDAWVIEEACAQSSRWLKKLGTGIKIAVNLSAKSLYHPPLVSFLEDTLQRYDVAPDRLELELTESAALRHVEAATDILLRLRNIGVALAIDDFGTGHSALAYLKRLSFDVLKIDRSFIQSLELDEVNHTLVRAIIAMAHALELQVVAEGVELPEQRKRLKDMSCDMIQGYMLSKPLPASEAEAMIRRLLPRINALGVL